MIKMIQSLIQRKVVYGQHVTAERQDKLPLALPVFSPQGFMVIFLFVFIPCLYSQAWLYDTTCGLRLIARPLPDSIMLRWAPVDYRRWEMGNRYGYKIVRYTLIRDEVLLPEPEEKILTPVSLKPLPMNDWQPLVEKDRYAAIAAQALFGKSFEVQTGNINPEMMKNKVDEQQQRVGFALCAADFSPAVARASGLMFTDREAGKNEKYLYRVMINVPWDEKIKSDTGYVFTGISEYTPLPRPIDLKADFKDRVVFLRWNSFVYNNVFIAYHVERSSDGKNFERINRDPLVQITTPEAPDPELMHASDSLPENGKTYFYRVQGITSFGELSPFSDIVSGKGTEQIAESPRIIKQEVIKGKVKLTWSFPVEKENTITGFRILRSEHDKTGFSAITSRPLKPSLREFIDRFPLPTAYYKIEAYKDTSCSKASFPMLVQLPDTIPPAKPEGLKGMADTTGIVRLWWLPGKDPDLYGYRIFRSVSGRDEFSQITVLPVTDTFFIDTISMMDLNREVFYKIVANDRHQNQSTFSDVLKITKPDRIPPSAPVFRKIENTAEGILIVWYNSSSPDVEKYILMRQNEGDTSWLKMAEVEHKKKESESRYHDLKAGNDTVRKYKITAVDFSGNVSEPALSVPLKGFKSMIKPPLKKIDVFVDNEKGKVLLKWKRPEGAIKNYLVYRKTKEKNYSLYGTLPGNALEFEDYGLKAGDVNAYRIKMIFLDGSVSGFSEEIIVKN